MKLKVKFDSQSIKEFFIHHTEKIVFGGMVAILLLLVYSAMGREQISFQPDELARLAEDAERHIQNTPPKSPRTPEDYLAISTRIKTPIEEQLYQNAVIWDQPLFDSADPRPSPPLLPVEELRIAAGHGGIPKNGTGGGMMEPGMSSEMGGGMPGMPGMPMGPTGPTGEGLRWVVLTGVVPDAKQREEALTAFQGTALPSPDWDRRRDVPEVIYYKVERAEVIGEGDSQRQLAWTSLHLRNAMIQAQQFRSSTQDVVDPRFIRNPPTAFVAFPLPPVANHVWGEEVAHLPQIPMAQRNPYGMPGDPSMPMEPGSVPAKPATKEDPTKPPADLPDAPMLNLTTPGYGQGGMPGMEPGMGMSMPGMGMGMGGEVAPMMPSGPEGYSAEGMPGSQGNMMVETRVRLFRFFDFTVEPGKRYKYRVKLMFTNPNQGLPIRILKSPELAKLKYLEADEWTEAKGVVTVPRDSRVLAGPVKPSVWSTIEPKGTLGIAFFDMKSGAEQFEEFKDVVRGQLLNYTGRPLQGTEPPPAMAGMDPMMMGGDPMMMGSPEMMPPDMMYPGAKPAKKSRKPKPKPEEQGEKVDYFTDTILLDMSGGSKLPGRDRDSTEPGRYLVFDPDGNLVVLDELDFDEEYKALNEPKPKTVPGYSPEMGMEGMPPEMMPGSIFEGMPTEGGGRRKPSRRSGP